MFRDLFCASGVSTVFWDGDELVQDDITRPAGHSHRQDITPHSGRADWFNEITRLRCVPLVRLHEALGKRLQAIFELGIEIAHLEQRRRSVSTIME